MLQRIGIKRLYYRIKRQLMQNDAQCNLLYIYEHDTAEGSRNTHHAFTINNLSLLSFFRAACR